jgi:hypothetical protein
MVTDPVRATRRRVAGYAGLGKRVGYLLFLASIVFVVVGLVGTFSTTVATGAIVCLIAGSIVLAPAIILGYAVNAAERDDRRRGY